MIALNMISTLKLSSSFTSGRELKLHIVSVVVGHHVAPPCDGV